MPEPPGLPGLHATPSEKQQNRPARTRQSNTHPPRGGPDAYVKQYLLSQYSPQMPHSVEGHRRDHFFVIVARSADRPFASQHLQPFISEEPTHPTDALPRPQNTMQGSSPQSSKSAQPSRIAKIRRLISREISGVATSSRTSNPKRRGQSGIFPTSRDGGSQGMTDRFAASGRVIRTPFGASIPSCTRFVPMFKPSGGCSIRGSESVPNFAGQDKHG